MSEGAVNGSDAIERPKTEEGIATALLRAVGDGRYRGPLGVGHSSPPVR